MKVLAIDPGKTSGVAALDWRGDETPQVLAVLVNVSVWDVPTLRHYLIKVKPDAVVLENFRLYPARARALSWDALEPVRIIGALEHICNDELWLPITYQSASQIAPWRNFTASLFKWKNVHVRDAATHALLYLMTKEGLSPTALREGVVWKSIS